VSASLQEARAAPALPSGGAGAATAPAAHESFLAHARFRHLKRALALVAASVAAYLAWEPPAGHDGGTWLGYTLGTVGALLIVWLMLFGVRKRRYGPGAFSLKAWLSAHVYLGLALVVVATLHASFQVGLNVHTLAYALTLLVVASGVWGVVGYAWLPARMTENRQGLTLEAMLREIAESDRRCAELAGGLGDEYVAAVRVSQQETRLGGSAWRLLSGRDPRCGTARALARVEHLATNLTGYGDRPARLVAALGRKAALLRRARRDLRLKALMDVWLLVHVPLSFALLAALVAHVVAVFYYWG
jgi:hypothetical protein